MWASELADEAPGVPLVPCATCGMLVLRDSHCADVEARRAQEVHVPEVEARSLRDCAAILGKALAGIGGVAHYSDIAESVGWSPKYTNNLLSLSCRKAVYCIVRVGRGTYAYLPEDLRRDRAS